MLGIPPQFNVLTRIWYPCMWKIVQKKFKNCSRVIIYIITFMAKYNLVPPIKQIIIIKQHHSFIRWHETAQIHLNTGVEYKPTLVWVIIKVGEGNLCFCYYTVITKLLLQILGPPKFDDQEVKGDLSSIDIAQDWQLVVFFYLKCKAFCRTLEKDDACVASS